MNDRYLFKAKRKNWKELPEKYWWVHWNIFSGCPEAIDESAICACTGILDKRENLIWENDIINTELGKAMVGWNHATWKIKWIQDTIWRKDLWYWVVEEDWGTEVIGSIFDNPELLEVE